VPLIVLCRPKQHTAKVERLAWWELEQIESLEASKTVDESLHYPNGSNFLYLVRSYMLMVV
jgi:hypothetical protein